MNEVPESRSTMRPSRAHLPPGGPSATRTLRVTEPRLPGLVTAMVTGLFALAGTGFLVGSVLTGGMSLAGLLVAGAVVAAVGGVAIRGAWRMLAPRVYFEAGPRGVIAHRLAAPVGSLPAGGSFVAPGALLPWEDVTDLQPAVGGPPGRGWLALDDGPRRLVRLSVRTGGDVYLPAFGEPGGDALVELLRELWAPSRARLKE